MSKESGLVRQLNVDNHLNRLRYHRGYQGCPQRWIPRVSSMVAWAIKMVFHGRKLSALSWGTRPDSLDIFLVVQIKLDSATSCCCSIKWERLLIWVFSFLLWIVLLSMRSKRKSVLRVHQVRGRRLMEYQGQLADHLASVNRMSHAGKWLNVESREKKRCVQDRWVNRM